VLNDRRIPGSKPTGTFVRRCPLVAALPAHQVRGDPAQLVVNQGDKLTPGLLVPGPGLPRMSVRLCYGSALILPPKKR
jgi:hypothetical protein